MNSALIIDGYVDEPAILGVPPYVGTYVRYLYGAMKLKGFDVEYTTIDYLRANSSLDIGRFTYIVIVGGLTVPGHYVGGTPINAFEARKIFSSVNGPVKVISGSSLHRHPAGAHTFFWISPACT
jgi:radical SAM superfamily enzyme with C-terminal helix-hairpin-helix motif